MPDGNETISSHLGLEPERLGDSRWAAFPRRASHGIGEFGQAQKGEVEWSGVERKWQAWTTCALPIPTVRMAAMAKLQKSEIYIRKLQFHGNWVQYNNEKYTD